MLWLRVIPVNYLSVNFRLIRLHRLSKGMYKGTLLKLFAISFRNFQPFLETLLFFSLLGGLLDSFYHAIDLIF